MKKMKVSVFSGLIAALLLCCAVFLGCAAEGDGPKTNALADSKAVDAELDGPGDDAGEEIDPQDAGPEDVVEEDVVVEEEEEEDQTPGSWEGLSAAREKLIIQDYFDIVLEAYEQSWAHVRPSIDNIRIQRYYGTYNGYSVVIFSWSVMTAGWSTVIGGVGFYQGTRPNITLDTRGIYAAWKGGVFYNIADLYDDGLLSYEDLLQIQQKENEQRGLH